MKLAYLKEVKANTKVIISSKTIEITDRVSKVEILMKSEDQKTINAVLWITVIYFNMKNQTIRSITRKRKRIFLKVFGRNR
jgi:acyl-CoA thioester hydrolase